MTTTTTQEAQVYRIEFIDAEDIRAGMFVSTTSRDGTIGVHATVVRVEDNRDDDYDSEPWHIVCDNGQTFTLPHGHSIAMAVAS